MKCDGMEVRLAQFEQRKLAEAQDSCASLLFYPQAFVEGAHLHSVLTKRCDIF